MDPDITTSKSVEMVFLEFFAVRSDFSKKVHVLQRLQMAAPFSVESIHPTLQLLHMAAPFFVQSAPVWGEPFVQVHVFTVMVVVVFTVMVVVGLVQAVLSELRVHPTLQLLHMAAPFFVQPAPVWGEPFVQLHTFASQALLSELSAHPTLQLLHMVAPFFVQPAPVWGEPFGQVHLFAEVTFKLRNCPVAHPMKRRLPLLLRLSCTVAMSLPSNQYWFLPSLGNVILTVCHTYWSSIAPP